MNEWMDRWIIQIKRQSSPSLCEIYDAACTGFDRRFPPLFVAFSTQIHAGPSLAS
jgi:hypothetical protein